MKSHFKLFIIPTIILAIFSIIVIAGSLSPSVSTSTPTMYTINDIYNFVKNNTVPGAHSLSPLVSTPTSTTTHSISDLYVALSNLMDPKNIVTGTTYLGVAGDFGSTTSHTNNLSASSSSLIPINTSAEGYTLEDVWNLINNITNTPGNHNLTSSAIPGFVTTRSLADIYIELSNLIKPVDVLNGVTYLGKTGTNIFFNGNGSVGNPYQISNWTQLNEVRNDLTANYILINNLTSSDGDYTGIGDSWVPIGDCGPGFNSPSDSCAFRGDFNGNGNTIAGLTITSPNYSVGLFGAIATGEISKIGLIDVSVSGGYFVGGLVGLQISGSIINSYSIGNVSGIGEVGGLVGFQYYDASITSSYSTGSVLGSSDDIGGLVGRQNGSITDSYAAVNVSGHYYIGGLVGIKFFGPISSSYSNGSVMGSYAGGLVGYQNSGPINNSFWNMQNAGFNMCGYGSCDNSKGKNNDEMKKLYTFNSSGGNWDIAGGQTDLNNGYPYLSGATSPVWNIADNTASDPSICEISGDATDPGCWSTQTNNLTWGPNPSTTGVSTDFNSLNGKDNTSILYGLSHTDYPAADYCYNLTEGGVPAGTWYLPSYAELWAGWGALNTTGFPANGYYWSSTESSGDPEFFAGYLSTVTGYEQMNTNYKEVPYSVRCLR